MEKKFHKGFFTPSHPEKYKGNVRQIVYRSSYEMKLMIALDRDPNIVEWSSEEEFIPYRSPIDGFTHRYFYDFKWKTGDGKVVIAEVKPLSQCSPPKTPQNNRSPKFLEELKTYAINNAKWEAAKRWAAQRDIEFKILTERELGIVIPTKVSKRVRKPV